MPDRREVDSDEAREIRRLRADTERVQQQIDRAPAHRRSWWRRVRRRWYRRRRRW